jgi:hypothetical protein
MPKELAWPPSINRNTPAWRTLENLFAQTPPSPDQNRLIVFGSAALQLTVVSNLLSADVDISLDLVTVGTRGITTPKAEHRLRRAAAKVNAGLSKDLPYIQVCHWMTFQPANRWERRSFEATQGDWRVVYPHPYDVLFSKLRRAEEKDIEAFRLIVERTGHPAQVEFIHLCKENYRDFEPRRRSAQGHLPDVVQSHDLRDNTLRVWRAIWGRPINIDREIVQAALEQVQGEWVDYDPSLARELARCAEPPRNRRSRQERRPDRNKPKDHGPKR